jgi:hypothetical protein
LANLFFLLSFRGAALTADVSAGPITIYNFVVTNTQDPSPTGFRVEVSGDATLASLPDPGTWVLIGLGLAGFGLLRLRAY